MMAFQDMDTFENNILYPTKDKFSLSVFLSLFLDQNIYSSSDASMHFNLCM